MVKKYNDHMGGIDLQDMLQSLYQIDRKSNKYYMRIVYYLFGIAMQNSWIQYRKSLHSSEDIPGRRMSLKEFLVKAATSLTKAGKPTERQGVGRPRSVSNRRQLNELTVPSSVRFDKMDHFPLHCQRGRCQYCPSGFSRWQYQKCQVHLCLNATNNCFTEFHK